MEQRKEAVECNGEERQKVHFKKKQVKCYFTSLLLIQLKPYTLYTKQTKKDSEESEKQYSSMFPGVFFSCLIYPSLELKESAKQKCQRGQTKNKHTEACSPPLAQSKQSGKTEIVKGKKKNNKPLFSSQTPKRKLAQSLPTPAKAEWGTEWSTLTRKCGRSGGSAVRNPPANAGDSGWIPELGRPP